MSFKDQLVPFAECGAAAVPRIRAVNPRVFACFVRNKNGNVVVLEGVAKGATLDSVEAYWLDLEPSYRQSARKKGRTHNRDDFGMMDHRAYGYKVTRINPTTLSLVFHQLPSVPMQVTLNGGVVQAHYTQRGQTYRLQHIYVHDNKAIIPTVEYIELHGFNQQGHMVREKLKR